MTDSLHRWHVFSTITILVLSVVSSLLGLFRPGHYRGEQVLIPQYYAEDLVILVVAVPVLAVALWYAMDGSRPGRLVWLGALAYMTYMWSTTALQVAFNEFFLGYVALFALSLFTLVGGLVTTDATSLQRALEGRISRGLYSAILLFIAVALAALWLSDLVPPTIQGTTPTIVEEVGEQVTVSHVLDLGVVVPSLVIASGWLWQGRDWGYVCAGVLLVLGALLAPTLTAITVVQVAGDLLTVPGYVIVLTFVPSLVALVLAATYVRALAGGPRPATGEAGQSNRPFR